jgi:hypothetical protein
MLDELKPQATPACTKACTAVREVHAMAEVKHLGCLVCNTAHNIQLTVQKHMHCLQSPRHRSQQKQDLYRWGSCTCWPLLAQNKGKKLGPGPLGHLFEIDVAQLCILYA